MVYEYKSPFAASVVKTLDSIGCGKLISIHEVDGNDCLIIDMGPMEIPQYPINPVMVIEQVCIIVRDKNIPLVDVYKRQHHPCGSLFYSRGSLAAFLAQNLSFPSHPLNP